MIGDVRRRGSIGGFWGQFEFGEKLHGLKNVRDCNPGTMLGKRTGRTEWRQSEICLDILRSKWIQLNLDLCASTSFVRSYDSFGPLVALFVCLSLDCVQLRLSPDDRECANPMSVSKDKHSMVEGARS